MVDKRVWMYLGEDLGTISEKDKEMLHNLENTGLFSKDEILAFNRSLVSGQYDEKLLKDAMEMNKKNNVKSVKEYYYELSRKKFDPSLLGAIIENPENRVSFPDKKD